MAAVIMPERFDREDGPSIPRWIYEHWEQLRREQQDQHQRWNERFEKLRDDQRRENERVHDRLQAFELSMNSFKERRANEDQIYARQNSKVTLVISTIVSALGMAINYLMRKP